MSPAAQGNQLLCKYRKAAMMAALLAEAILPVPKMDLKLIIDPW
jgi:hypothetical protein